MSTGKVDVPSEFRELSKLGFGSAKSAGKPLREAMGQLTEALKTGGVGAKIPMIQRAVEQQKQASSQASTQTAEQLARRNIGGTAAGRILAGQNLAARSAESRIPTDIASAVIGQGLPLASNLRSMGMGGIQAGGQADLQAQQFNALQFKALMQDIKSSLQSTGSSACLHPDCAIETPFGAVPVRDIKPGDTVWTVGREGDRVRAKVTDKRVREVPDTHVMLRVYGPGGDFLVTPTHPMPDGQEIGDVIGGELLAGQTTQTMDIEVGGPTGAYFVCGMALGSTLDYRHKKAA
jgi:hypothetical protein